MKLHYIKAPLTEGNVSVPAFFLEGCSGLAILVFPDLGIAARSSFTYC